MNRLAIAIIMLLAFLFLATCGRSDMYNLAMYGVPPKTAIYLYQIGTSSGDAGSENDAKIVSNQLTINLRPGDIEEDYIVELKSLEDEKRLFAEKKSPDEVVRYVLDARMKGEWEKFFLYIELEKLIQWNNIFNSRYRKADIERKKEILTEYKEYLKQNSIDEISYLPHGYKIMRTEYTEGKAKVETIVEYKYIDYIEKKYYTYFLFKKGSVWYIESYEVMNLGSKE